MDRNKVILIVDDDKVACEELEELIEGIVGNERIILYSH